MATVLRSGMQLRRVAQLSLSHIARYQRARSAAPHFLFVGDRGEYTIANATLAVQHTGMLPSGAGAVDISPSGQLLAIASNVDWVVMGWDGTIHWQAPHRAYQAWESGDIEFLDEEQLIIVEPDGDGVKIEKRNWQADAITGTARIELPASGGHHLAKHPSQTAWILWSGAGQDGQWSHRVVLADDTFQFTALPGLATHDHGAPLFSADGTTYITTNEDGIVCYRWSDDKLECFEAFRDGTQVNTAYPLQPNRWLVHDSEAAHLWLVSPKAPWQAIELESITDRLRERLWSTELVPSGRMLTVHGWPPHDTQLVTLYQPLP